MKQLTTALITLYAGCAVAHAEADPALERLAQTPVSVLQYGEMRFGDVLSSLFEDEWRSVWVSNDDLEYLTIAFDHHRQKIQTAGDGVELCKSTFDKLRKSMGIDARGVPIHSFSYAPKYFKPHNMGNADYNSLAKKIDELLWVSISVRYGQGDESGYFSCTGQLLGEGLKLDF